MLFVLLRHFWCQWLKIACLLFMLGAGVAAGDAALANALLHFWSFVYFLQVQMVQGLLPDALECRLQQQQQYTCQRAAVQLYRLER
jgi:hypothetical protein